MTTENLKSIEAELRERGYRKYMPSSPDGWDYVWSRSIANRERRILTIIEFAVYDSGKREKFAGKRTICIQVNISISRSDRDFVSLELPYNGRGVEETEETVSSFIVWLDEKAK